MKTMIKKKFMILLSLIISLTLVSPLKIYGENTIASYEDLSRLAGERANFLVEAYQTTSIQYALIHNGEIKISGNSGVYSRSEDIPLSPETMYGIGSLSKTYTSTAILRLVDKGYIDLDESVTTYLPNFTMEDERYKDITVRMLLNHSSGLMGSTFRNAFLFDDNDSYARDNLLENLSKQRLKSDPGSFSVYCNDGFTLAELIVEEVSGLTFTEFMEEEFFKPLGLKNTKTPESNFDRSRLAKTYFPLVEGPLPIDSVNVIGTGGIYSTAEDVVNFFEIYMNNPSEGKKDFITRELAEKSFEREYLKGMWPSEHDNILGFGLGWDSVDLFPFNQNMVQAVAKGGDTVQFHSNLILLPEQNMAMAVLSSGGVSIYNQTFASEILLEALKLEGYIEDIKVEGVNIPAIASEMPKEVKEFSGFYASITMIQKIDISSDGLLTRTIPSIPELPPQEFVYTQEGIFAALDGSGSLSFVEEENGNIYLSTFGYASLPGLGQIASMEYSGQKIEPFNLEGEIQEQWDARNGKNYYIINEKYSSQTYLLALPKATIELNEEMPGYMSNLKIIDGYFAKTTLEIPGTAGRDLSDFKIYQEGGREFIKSGASILISEDHIETLYTGGQAHTTILEDGYARWYRVGADGQGRTIVVDIPENSSFAIYDQGVCHNFSWVTGENTVKLNEGSLIVFIGDIGSKFNIVYK